jgi:hypothetical protein
MVGREGVLNTTLSQSYIKDKQVEVEDGHRIPVLHQRQASGSRRGTPKFKGTAEEYT